MDSSGKWGEKLNFVGGLGVGTKPVVPELGYMYAFGTTDKNSVSSGQENCWSIQTKQGI
jgi:hypothetical protein